MNGFFKTVPPLYLNGDIVAVPYNTRTSCLLFHGEIVIVDSIIINLSYLVWCGGFVSC